MRLISMRVGTSTWQKRASHLPSTSCTSRSKASVYRSLASATMSTSQGKKSLRNEHTDIVTIVHLDQTGIILVTSILGFQHLTVNQSNRFQHNKILAYKLIGIFGERKREVEQTVGLFLQVSRIN
jgi:hypothetical protein